MLDQGWQGQKPGVGWGDGKPLRMDAASSQVTGSSVQSHTLGGRSLALHHENQASYLIPNHSQSQNFQGLQNSCYSSDISKKNHTNYRGRIKLSLSPVRKHSVQLEAGIQISLFSLFLSQRLEKAFFLHSSKSLLVLRGVPTCVDPQGRGNSHGPKNKTKR